jgi:hypothetical protein
MIPCSNCFPPVNDFEETYKNDENETIVFYKRYLSDTVNTSSITKNGCGTNHVSMDIAKKQIELLQNKGFKLENANSKSGMRLYMGLLWHIFGYCIYKVTGLC